MLLITITEQLSSWHQAVLAMFFRFWKPPFSCTEVRSHSSIRPPNFHIGCCM